MNALFSTQRLALLSWLPLVFAIYSHSVSAVDTTTKIVKTQKPFELKLGATRVIYHEGASGATLSVINNQDYPMLVKSQVFAEDKKSPAPFIVTPPLFRLEGQQQSRLRIVSTGGGGELKNRETLQWLCVTGIPPKADDAWAKKNGKSVVPSTATLEVQISVSTCVKMLVRPSSLKGTPDDVASLLIWQRVGNKLKVTNPTPFYMNISSLRVGGHAIKSLSYIPPSDTREIPLPQAGGSNIEWKLITDYGGESRTYTANLK